MTCHHTLCSVKDYDMPPYLHNHSDVHFFIHWTYCLNFKSIGCIGLVFSKFHRYNKQNYKLSMQQSLFNYASNLHLDKYIAFYLNRTFLSSCLFVNASNIPTSLKCTLNMWKWVLLTEPWSFPLVESLKLHSDTIACTHLMLDEEESCIISYAVTTWKLREHAPTHECKLLDSKIAILKQFHNLRKLRLEGI